MSPVTGLSRVKVGEFFSSAHMGNFSSFIEMNSPGYNQNWVCGDVMRNGNNGRRTRQGRNISGELYQPPYVSIWFNYLNRTVYLIITRALNFGLSWNNLPSTTEDGKKYKRIQISIQNIQLNIL